MVRLQGLQEIRKKDWRKWFRRDNLIMLVLSGILLFVIALPTKDGGGRTDQDARKAKEGIETDGGETAKAGGGDTAGYAWEAYAAKQEQRLEAMLADMEGVGKVQVMLTISDSEELVVEKDIPFTRSDTSETDSAGGSRVISQRNSAESTVYRSAGGDSEPYVVKTRIPRVEGVLVVAQGAGTGSVNKDITEIAKALFGVEAHKVKVVRMEMGR